MYKQKLFNIEGEAGGDGVSARHDGFIVARDVQIVPFFCENAGEIHEFFIQDFIGTDTLQEWDE